MEKISTLNKILLFHYGDLPYPDKVEMATILAVDQSIRSEYNTLKETLKELPKVTFMPTDATLDFVLKYSTQQV